MGHRRGGVHAGPAITVGFGTPLLFVTAALRRRHAGLASAGGLWASTAVYTAAVVALFHPFPANAMPPLLGACIVVLTIGAGTHAAVFVVLAALNTDHQDAGRCDRPVGVSTHQRRWFRRPGQAVGGHDW